MIARVYLGVAALVFCGLGLALLVWPVQILKHVEVSFNTTTAFADIRADYGGCLLGVGVFLGWCVSKSELVRVGLLCTGLTFTGYASGRLLSLVLDGMPKPIIFTLTIIEVMGAATAFGLIPFAPPGLGGSQSKEGNVGAS